MQGHRKFGALTIMIACLTGTLFTVPAMGQPQGGAPTAPTTKSEGEPEDNSEAPKLNDEVRLLPFTVTSKASGGPIQTDWYTRLVVENALSGGSIETKKLSYAKRKWYSRLGIAKKYSATVSLKADAARFSATTPLLSREYESSRKKGENFSRSINYDSLDFPLFLVGSDSRNGVGRFKLTVDVSEETDLDIATHSLALVTKALNAVAPTSGVLTSLSEQSSKDVAEALDKAIGSLYATSIKEAVDFDIDLKNGGVYTIEIYGPRFEVNETYASVLIGKWTIKFADARPSIFSTKRNEREAIAEAQAKYPAILSYELVNKLGEYASIGGYLKQQDWWASDLTKLSDDKTDRAAFCRKIRSAIATLGLNDLDGRLITQAALHSENVPSDIAAKIDLSAFPDCMAS